MAASSSSNVVVIGGGYAGVRLARRLDDVARVTLVDRKEAFFHRIASLRASVDEEWTREPFIPYDRLLRNGRFAMGKVVRLETMAREVVLADGTRLPYDVVVIATGADYPEPARFAGTTVEEAAKSFLQHQQRIAQASRVLVVGGGPSGVELASEIRLAHPATPVTLAHSGPELLISTGSLRAGARARGWMRQHGVEVLLDTFVSPGTEYGTFTDARGNAIEADLVFWATGITPNTLWLRLAGHSDWLNETGHVKVDAQLRVEGKQDVFAIGDVTNVSEAKISPAAVAQADAAVHNIRSYLGGAGRHRGTLKAYRPTPRRAFAVPFGMTDGVTVLPGPGGRELAVMGNRFTAAIKGRTLFRAKMLAELGQRSAGGR